MLTTILKGARRERPFRDGALWWLTKDGDLSVRDLYRRHYSSRKSRRTSDLVVGPGDKLVLRSAGGDAAFVWRRAEHRRDKQIGVECTLFRNEGPHLSSLLIRQADAVAYRVWPGLRHYTFVDEEAVGGDGGGACFRAAGWRAVRGNGKRTKGGLLIMEHIYSPIGASPAIGNLHRLDTPMSFREVETGET